MAHVCILYAIENQAFASKIENVLFEMGHVVSRREIDEEHCAVLGSAEGEPDAMIVIWSGSSIASPLIVSEARTALARRTLTPVAIGRIEPPASFQHLWPIDLSGWAGSQDDPRWRFVADEIDLSIRRSALGFDDEAEEDDRAPIVASRVNASSRIVLFGGVVAFSALALSAVALAPFFFSKERAGDQAGDARTQPSVAFVQRDDLPAEGETDALGLPTPSDPLEQARGARPVTDGAVVADNEAGPSAGAEAEFGTNADANIDATQSADAPPVLDPSQDDRNADILASVEADPAGDTDGDAEAEVGAETPDQSIAAAPAATATDDGALLESDTAQADEIAALESVSSEAAEADADAADADTNADAVETAAAAPSLKPVNTAAASAASVDDSARTGDQLAALAEEALEAADNAAREEQAVGGDTMEQLIAETAGASEASGDEASANVTNADEAGADEAGDASAPADQAAPEDDVVASLVQAAEESAAGDGEVSPGEEGAETPDPIEALVENAVFDSDVAFGAYFRECLVCPDMAELPGGSFTMGTPPNEPARNAAELPPRSVTIPYRYALSAREVTYDQWAACVAEGGCSKAAAADPGWGRGKRPVVNVSYEDAQDYARWLSGKTGQTYRLPTEAEWEFAARAGASTPFSFGSAVTTSRANYNGQYKYGGPAGVYRRATLPTGSFKPNAYGLYDMHGNVWEWTSDCWQDACEKRVLKGGAWNSGGWRLRAGHRISGGVNAREFDNGFRVARRL
ncbi:MAG: SUMF1/EgtB/PvdO family nonheme iron enzyme [Pseudomonadota bacterium]